MSTLLSQVSRAQNALKTLLASLDLPANVATYRSSADGIRSLLTTLAEDFDVGSGAGARTSPGSEACTPDQLKKKLSYQKKRRTDAEHALESALGQKHAGRIAHLWFVRVGLADPGVPAISLERFCRDYPVEETQTISHTYVGTVRDAFVEIVKGHCLDQVADLVMEAKAAQRKAPNAHHVQTEPFILCHVQDEAHMRLRSYDPKVDAAIPGRELGARPVRSRTSKIQNNVLVISRGDMDIEFYSELQSLQRKDADTIALAMVEATSPVIKAMMAAIGGNRNGCSRIRLIHCVTGDAIPTNAAAMRRLYHYWRQDVDEHNMIEYMLVGFVCSSHQCNLVVQVAVVGRLMWRPEENDTLTANCSRWFRHLLSDYAEEYALSLKIYVDNPDHVHMSLARPPPAAQQRTSNLLKLYGPNVLPSDVLAFFDGDIAKREHVLLPDEDPYAARREAFKVLHKHLVRVEEKPIVTRFWLFGSCVRTLQLMSLLDMRPEAFQVVGVKPKEENSTRARRFWKFFMSDRGKMRIRVSALCLELTDHATNITARKRCAGDGSLPALVLISQGHVQRRASEDLRRILTNIFLDDALDYSMAVASLLATAGHIVIRFDVYNDFPAGLWRLTRAFNPEEYVVRLEEFLTLPAHELDVGYGCVLQREALSMGDLPAALRFLLSDPVQDELKELLEKAQPTSLDAERKHFLDKRGEGRRGVRVTTVARSSRNSILRRYGARRNPMIAKTVQSRSRALSMRHMNVRALAIQRNPHLFARGRGRLHWEQHISEQQTREITSIGNESALQAYIDENRDELETEAKLMRRNAKEALRRADNPSPFTNAEWLQWLDRHDDEFRALLRTATAKRKVYNRRLQAEATMPAGPRLQPERAKAPGHSWVKMLAQQKHGFFVVCHSGRMVVLFICALKGEVWAMQLHRDQDSDLDSVFLFEFETLFCDRFKPIQKLIAEDVGLPAGDLGVSVSALDMKPLQPKRDGLPLAVRRSRRVELKERAPSHRTRDEKGGDCDPESESGSEEFAEDPWEDLRSDDISGGSLVSDVDTDLDVGLDEGSSSSSDGVLDSMRMPRGIYTVRSTGYFTMTRNPNYADVKIVLQNKRAQPGLLGTGKKSKTVQIRDYDVGGAPHMAFLVLRSWMLWRSNVPAFLTSKAARQRWHDTEALSLRDDILRLAVSGGSTGNPAADDAIKRWWPAALA